MIFDYFRDKYNAHLWAKNLIDNEHFLILDSETTGLESTDQIIEISVIDNWGTTLIDTYIKPSCPISEGAYKCHGIDEKQLKNAPSFPEVYEEIKRAIEGKKVIIYNSGFDVNKLAYMCWLHELPEIKFNFECAMFKYAEYYGQWHDYYCNYTWKKLPSGNHKAKGDANACLKLVKRMAETLKCDVNITRACFPSWQLELKRKNIYIEIVLRERVDFFNVLKEINFVFPLFSWQRKNNANKITAAVEMNLHDCRVVKSQSYQEWLKSDLTENYENYTNKKPEIREVLEDEEELFF